MKIVVNENFNDFGLCEFPYDKNHSALGEYHYLKQDGYYGNWYDPIVLHQWRSLDGSWLVTSNNGVRYLEQNRGDNCKNAYKDVYCCLVYKDYFYSDYVIEFDLNILEVNEYCGFAFNYLTSRCYDFVGIKNNKLSLIRRYNDEFIILKSVDILFDDLTTYHFKISVSSSIKVDVNGNSFESFDCSFINKRKIAFVSKSACKYSKLIVSMNEENYQIHTKLLAEETNRLACKRELFPKLECIKKIDLGNFGSGRQLRIRRIKDKTIFVIAQHQKRMFRDAFACISCLTCFDEDGNVLWQKGEPSNSFENTMISCDLPFQIADVNGDNVFEIIYVMDFKVIIADLLTGKEIKSMDTPIVHGDLLVKNHPFYRLNVDAIRVADFSGLGYKSDFIIKDRYQNVWAYNKDFVNIWRYNHKNTGHFPYIYDFNDDGKDEMFVGYDLVSSNGEIIFSLPMNTDHTDEIIYTRLYKDEPKRLVLASGNEGVNICNIDGSIYKHNNIGHAQRISVAKYKKDVNGLQILATSFWGADGIVCLYDGNGNLLKQIEQMSNGNLITPVNYDGKNILALLNGSLDGGLIDGDLDKVVLFENDGHPTLCQEVYDIDGDGIDEIICWDLTRMWIYKAKKYCDSVEYYKYSDDAFSNYRGEYLIPLDYD